MLSSLTRFNWGERTATKQNETVRKYMAQVQGRIHYERYNGSQKTLVEVHKKPIEKQVGCIRGDKQEAKEPFILSFNEKLCQVQLVLAEAVTN